MISNFNSSSSSSSSKPKMLNPKAQEWTPKPPALPSPPLSHIPFTTLVFWFYPVKAVLLPSFPEPAKPVFSGSVKLVEITDHQDQEAKRFALVKKKKKTKGQFLKRPKCPFSNSRAPKVDRSGTRIFYADPPRLDRRAQRSLQNTAQLSPKKEETKNSHGGAPPPDVTGNTTVMIRNIPNKIRRDFLLNFMDKNCKDYSLEYDFLYLPMDFRTLYNRGYAFVNFTTAASALTFKNAMEGCEWSSLCTSKKIVNVKWATDQGREALIKRFERSFFNCKSLDYLPVLLDPPRDGSDPNPPPPVVVGRLRWNPK